MSSLKIIIILTNYCFKLIDFAFINRKIMANIIMAI